MMNRRWMAVLGILLLAACNEGYDPPDQANPFDTIAPAPTDTSAVGGAATGGSGAAAV